MFVDRETKETNAPFREQHESLDEASKLLLKAAALLEECGHCKHAREYQGRFCVMGALSEARFGDHTKGNDRLVIEAANRLSASVFPGGTYANAAAVHWNNAAERTADEVVAKLRAVAIGG